MGTQCLVLNPGGEQGKPGTIAVSVAFDPLNTQRRHYREVLQEGDRADVAEILPALDRGSSGMGLAARRQQTSIRHALKVSLAVLVARAGIS